MGIGKSAWLRSARLASWLAVVGSLDSFFRVPSLEAGAFPGHLLLVAAYYLQIRETCQATCTLGALAMSFLEALEAAVP